jgi:AraC-like DNA-binding protein
MDALTGLLSEVRSSGAVIGRTILTPPWSIRFADRAPLTLVSMLRGGGWIVPDEGQQVAIREAEVAIVVGSEPFVVADTPYASAPLTYTRSAAGHCTAAGGTEATDEPPLGLRTCGESTDGPMVLLTGSYQVWGRVSASLLGALPRVLVVPHAGELCPVLDLTVAEMERDTPGQQAVLDRLLDLLLLSALREWFALPGAKSPGWYRAMGDGVVGRALRLLHKYPARAWTVTDLASRVGVSRATLARRFTDLVGEPPMAYLTSWRLCVATDLLEHTSATVDAIARQVGYESAFGLSVAFKRVYGTRPSQHRAAISA